MSLEIGLIRPLAVDLSTVRYLERELTQRRVRSMEFCADDEYPTYSLAGGISSMAIDKTSDDRYLLVGRGNGELLLHDLCLPAAKSRILACKRSTAQKIAHKFSISSMSWFSSDNGIFVTGAKDRKVIVWDTAAFKPVCTFLLSRSVNSVALSPIKNSYTGSLIACGTDSRTIRLCDMKSGAHSQVLAGHRASVQTCGFSPVSEYVVATGSADHSIRLWDLRRSGESACFANLDQHRVSENVLGKRKRKSVLDAQNTAHDGPVMALRFICGGNYLLSSGGERRLRLWTLKRDRDSDSSYRTESVYENLFVNYTRDSGVPTSSSGVFEVSDVACSHKATTVFHVLGTAGASVGVFDLLSGKAVPSKQLEHGHFMQITSLVLRESMQELYSAGQDGLILRWGHPTKPPDPDEYKTVPEQSVPIQSHMNPHDRDEGYSDWESAVDDDEFDLLDV
mmetsp:Transcript_27009/g.43506  ORF Transcript_27009/g.43506 Transcript_27009/m.43506 type:complete len:451 (+) Transcript_27009:581-1933(+)|eukprot:CAMPEP_0203762172 /NCGR_PEP_ID=MMETSP0098-20131031/15113_1 /ASSEMBLY_ACC=CAM_ASM_000208 /TAXON_ID=96639 /ORGANISM=" , Strain NY0313808BC1" /LENGTH=450 /DNA_ID=CAMNT_0050656477 /DNA_START=460 /DNA_END=1812 /DNA_ORIENTATION=-